MDTTIIIPVYNEEESIKIVLQEIKDLNMNYNVLIINDNSTDNTPNILSLWCENNEGFKFINSSNNQCLIYQGIINCDTRWIATLDGDGENDPTDLKKCLEYKENLKDDKIGLISCFRKNRTHPKINLISSKIGNKVINSIIKSDCKDIGCAIKVFKKEIGLEMVKIPHPHRYIHIITEKLGYKFIQFETIDRQRLGGKSKYNLFKKIIYTMDDLIKVYKYKNN
jgi:dolichol-phosphate mannosyltransferase